jgi:tetratricopeptide (TPR) repeat protein
VSADSAAFYKALELESAGKYREAVALYRASMRGENTVNAFMGLERVMHGLGWLDSLLAPIDSLVRAVPTEKIYRVAQLRTLQMMARPVEVRRAFEQWVRDVPGAVDPYHEYASLLLQLNRRSAADSVVREAERVLGSIKGLEIEEAQVRAGAGEWVKSASAWRAGLVGSPHYETAAAYSLNPTPRELRPEVRRILMAPPIDNGARRALASLEVGWGSTADGWIALRDLPADSTSVDAWTDFGDRAMADERWTVARDALTAAYAIARTPDLALRAATASLNAGDPAAVFTLIPLARAGRDSATIARSYVPLHARALSQVGQPDAAEQLVKMFERFIAPGPRAGLTRTIALGWVRRGDLDRARAALAAAGGDADSSDTAGWLALYDGDLRSARTLLRGGSEATSDVAVALGVVARVEADRSPEIGAAFLALARADSAGAASRFETAAGIHREAASALRFTAAQIRAGLSDLAGATLLWTAILDSAADSPEAPHADLEWARALRRAGNGARAIERLEHLILTYPASALVPQARRELDQLKGRGGGGTR